MATVTKKKVSKKAPKVKREPVIKETDEGRLVIPAPNFQQASFRIIGTAPYVQNKFSNKAVQAILAAQQESKAKTKKSKEPRNIEEDYKNAFHRCSDDSYGIPAPAFRAAMISACRVAGFVMAKAKLSVFVEADDYDVDDGTPLVRLHGEPEMHKASVRLKGPSGTWTVAIRPMWREWNAVVRCTWDGDQFSKADLANLLTRAGLQVGVGEGRPDSRESYGQGWGTFRLANETD